MDNQCPRVLVIDDERETLDLCGRIFRGELDVVGVDSAEAALTRLETETFSLLIADHALPGMDGLEFLSRAKTENPEVGRILMTGDTQVAIEAINTAQVHRFILKPWRHQDFHEVVRQEVRIAQLRLQLDNEHRRHLRLLYDEQYHLPTRLMVQDQIAGWLERDGHLSVVVIYAEELWALQGAVSTDQFGALKDKFLNSLKEMRGMQVRQEDSLVVDEVGSACFCLFLSQPRTESIRCAADVEVIARRIQDHLGQAILGFGLPVRNLSMVVSTGSGFTLLNPHLSVEHQLRQTVAMARQDALTRLKFDDTITRRSQLERIIVGKQIWNVFQPIVDLRSSAPFAHEALGRGPSGTEFESPAFLLGVADRANLSAELDRVFRSTALINAAKLPGTGKIFINTLPATIYDPKQGPEHLASLFSTIGLDPARVVFEFSERYVVTNDEMLADALQAHRRLGIEMAIDDVGAGYSGLDRIAKLAPNYLKIDESLVRDVDKHNLKRSVLGVLTKLGQEIGAKVIAEGIESEDERAALLDLGVPLGQGYLLGRPRAL